MNIDNNIDLLLCISLLNSLQNSSSKDSSIFEYLFSEILSSANTNPYSISENNNINSSSSDNTLGSLDSILNLNNISYSNTVESSDSAIDLAYKQLGKPYIWGSTGPDSFDCSGLTSYIYKNAYNKVLPRVSYEQAEFGQYVNKEDLLPGDLIFFDTMNKGRVSHTGIYVGNNEFIHAAGRDKGVIKSTLSGYYASRYICARRP